MKKQDSTVALTVKELLSKYTVSELLSTMKDLNLKGYSKKSKSEIVNSLYQRVTNKEFMEDLLLICDRQVWNCLLEAASVTSPVRLPSPLLNEPCKTIARFGLLQLVEGESGGTILMPAEVKKIFSQFETDGFMKKKDRCDLLDHYALAVTRLYGLIHQEEFVAIFNSQNNHKTDVDEVFSVLIQHISADAPYGFWDEYLTHSLFEDNEYKDAEDLLKVIAGKRRFVPERGALLQYGDPCFFEKTPISDQFEHYLVTKLHCSEQKAHEITSEVVFSCAIDNPIERTLRTLGDHNFPFTKENIQQLMPLLVNLSNHTRKWSDCGFTPEEVRQKNLRRLPVRQSRKIGRNEPCPCGSGKKYKKCCGR